MKELFSDDLHIYPITEKRNLFNLHVLKFDPSFFRLLGKILGLFIEPLYNTNVDLVNDNVFTKFGRILPHFKLIRDIMVVLHTCNNEEDPIKMKTLEC